MGDTHKKSRKKDIRYNIKRQFCRNIQSMEQNSNGNSVRVQFKKKEEQRMESAQKTSRYKEKNRKRTEEPEFIQGRSQNTKNPTNTCE